MKKKIIFSLLALAMAFSMPAVADNNQPILFNQLPAPAQAFIKKYFKVDDVSAVVKDKELLSVSYDVIMNNGTTIDFDRKGNWRDVDGKRTPIPTAIIPTPIRQYVKKHYPRQQVVQLERKSNGRHEVELDNDLTLVFNAQHRFVSIDN